MRIEEETKLDFKDVLIRPKRSTLSSRKEVDLKRTYKFKHSKWQWTGVPIIASNMDGVGTTEVAEALYEHRMFTCLVKSYNHWQLEPTIDKIGGNYLAVSTGTSERDLNKLVLILDTITAISFICIDVANGYSEHFGDFVSEVRRLYPKHTIIAGNVVTADMTQELILRGADIVKVGIGPGCFTPDTLVLTNEGWKAISSIKEGDLVLTHNTTWEPVTHLWNFDHHKQLVAVSLENGSEYKMTPDHKVFAIHQSKADQGGGRVVENNDKRMVEFYGMSSDTAMNKHHGGIADYRSSEGRTVMVPYKGDINVVVKDILGGIRSTCTYVGAPTLKQLAKCTTFIKVNRQINDVYVK
jgi:GMP reductase